MKLRRWRWGGGRGGGEGEEEEIAGCVCVGGGKLVESLHIKAWGTELCRTELRAAWLALNSLGSFFASIFFFRSTKLESRNLQKDDTFRLCDTPIKAMS